ncbi:cell wall-binding repeat-containing protein, partial [Desulfosporosinus sp. BG]|uniref:cell wall-binding repeat-containing protein n=1 Tax=Desulfosporosinus sp. BG TaxID=1633135 RepID=UPI00083B02EA
AVNSSDTSSYSSKENATTEESDESDTLSAPTDLSASAESSNEIFLDWGSVSDATSYYVYRATSSSGTYSKIATTKTSSYTDTDLSTDTTYYYKVSAVNSSGTSSYSSTEHATTEESDEYDIPSAPTDLSAKFENSSEINLDWDAVSDATSYYVYRATSSSGTYYKIATTTTSSYTDMEFSADTTYYYKVVAVNNSGTSNYSAKASATSADSDNSTPSDTSSQFQFERLAGEDMYETCAKVANGWSTSYYAIIVSGDNFSDALCSAPLAQKYNAPLLLTSRDTLNEHTKTQLSRLKVKNVIMIGGVGVISTGVEQSIKNLGIEVSRIAGNNSYETSIKIAQSMGQFDQAVIASSETFPDALSIAPIAAMKGIPILLTPKDNLPGNVKAYLLKTVKSTYVVGGTGVISESVLNQLPSPKRLSGIDRYETNIRIIKEFENELRFNISYLSTGENFADALAGAALASLTDSPVFLVRDPVDQSTRNFFRGKRNSIEKEIVFGGIVVVPDSILISLNETTNGSDTPSAPANLKATTASSSQINLTWDPVQEATSYYVYGATSSSGTYTQIATVTTAGYINTGLWADTTYYYKIKAVNDAGTSSYSSIDYAKTNLSDD